MLILRKGNKDNFFIANNFMLRLKQQILKKCFEHHHQQKLLIHL